MKHLFTLSEWLKDKWVGMVNLVMQFLKLTKRQSDTTFFAKSAKVSKCHDIFAKSLKSLMSIFVGNESYESTVRYALKSRITTTYLRLASVFTLVFVMGVGNVWGAEDVYKNTTFNSTNNSKSVSSYTDSWSNTTSGFQVNLVNANNNNNGWNYIKMGRKNNASVATIITNSAIDKKINKVSITIDALTASKINSIKLYKSTNGSSWTELGSFTKATGEQNCTIAANNQAANLYYKLEFDCASGSGNGLITVSAVNFYAETFTVTYNSNGGSGSMTDGNSPYFTGSTVTVLSNSFSAPANKEFDEWKTGASSGTSYAAGATFNISANTTLYAQWKNSAVATPSITPSVTELDWGTVNKGADLSTKTFTITGSNLTAADLVYTANGGYSVSPTGKDGAAGALASQTLTVTPPSAAIPGTYNSTVTISGGGLASAVSVAVKLTVQNTDQFIDELHGTTGYTSASPHIEAGSYGTTPSIADKGEATSGTCLQQHYHFMGWITAAKYEAGTAIAVGDLQTPTSATGATYYAVWAKKGAEGSDNEELTNNELKTNVTNTQRAYDTAKKHSDGDIDYTFNVYTDAANRPWVQLKSADPSAIKIEAPGNISRVDMTITSATNSSGGVADITKHDAFSTTGTISLRSTSRTGTVVASNTGANASDNVLSITVSSPANSTLYLTTSTGCRIWGITVYYSTISYEDYRAVCCTELGSINGSVSMTQTTAALEWADLDHVSSWAVQYKTHDAANWSDWNGAQSTANSKRSVTINSLSCGTAYDFKIAATAASGYCDAEQVIENQSTTKWDISYELSNTVYLGENDGPEEGANACGEISATFSKNALYSFPENITVTIGGEEATADTDYLWDADEGTLYIDAAHVTGNVAVTIAGVAPANPVVTPNPTALSFTQVKKGADVPAAQDITLEGHNLTADLTVVSSNTSLYVVSLKSGSLTPDNNKDASPVITVTPQAGITSTAGDKDATITISGGGLAADVVVNVTFNVQETYTVNWYVNGTDNLHLARTQTDIVGTDLTEIPSDFTDATDCSDKTFMGWTEDDDYSDENDAPEDLFNATEGMKITSANKNYYAVFADKNGGDDLTGTLTESEIQSHYTTASHKYSDDAVSYLDGDITWNAIYNVDAEDRPWIQFNNTAYLQITAPKKITQVKVIVTSTQNKSGGIADKTKYNAFTSSVTLSLKAATNAETAVGSATTNTTDSYQELTLNVTSGNNTSLYLMASGSYRLWGVTVTYADDPEYSNYVTVCPHVSRVTLSAPEVSNGSISFAQDSKAVTSVRTDGGADVDVDVVPDPATGYELTGVALSGAAASHASYDAGVITIDAGTEGALTATATFAQANYTVTMAQTGGASAELSADQTNKHYNDVITVTAEDKAGYVFQGWSASPAVTFANAKALSTTFSMPDGNVEVTATYEAVHDVAWALANTPSTGSSDSVYVKGLISKKEKLESDNTISYWISDNGQHTTGSVLEVYKGKGVNKVTFSSLDDLNVGDAVVVRGKLKTFSGTKEFDNGNYMYSRTAAAVASVAIGGSAEKTAYSPSDNTFSFAGLTATATYNTGYVKDVTAEATWTANNANPYTVAASGDVTVRAAFGGQSDEEVVTVTYTSKTIKSIYLEYESIYTFKGYDLPKPKVYAEYVEDIDDDEITSLVEAANGYDTESAYNKNTPDNYTIKVEYESFNAEYTVQVRKIFDNEDAPHNVADANALITAVGTSSESSEYMWVRGIVCGFDGSYYNRYYISDNGTAEGRLYVYYGKYFNDASFDANNKLKVGDVVILKAKIKIFSSTNELTSSQVTYQLRDPAFAFADVVAGDEFEAGFSADMTIVPTSNEGDAAFTLSSGNTDAVTIVAGKLHAVAEGDAEITASRAATDNTGSINYKAKNVTFNVHVIAERTRFAITMDKNGGSGTDPVYDDQLAGVTVDLPADNTYSKANSAFDAWVVTETVSGDAVAVTDGHFTMPAAAVTIKATWNEVETCHISFMVSGSEVATADAPQTAAYSLDGVSHPTVEGFTFIGWSETEYDDETTTLPTTITSYTPAVNEDSKTLYGIYSQVVGGASNKHYVLDYADENLGTNTSWGDSYNTSYDYTATDGGEWTIKAYKNSGMQINTGKSAYIKVPECAANIIQISLTCSSSAKAALKFAETTSGDVLATGTESTSQTLDLSGETVTTGYILPSGNCQITHIDVEYSGNVTYYTSSPITRYNVTYAKGDATNVTGVCEAQRHAAGAITLCDAPTCADKNFAKWSDGTSLYAAGASYTLSADVTFTATWTDKPKYTVTYTANGGTGTAPAVEEYLEGATVTVKENECFSKPGFDYDGWLIVYNDGVSDQEITPENGEFEMVAYNVTIKAKWAEESKQKWALVTDVKDLKAGDKYIIAAAGSNVAMAGQNANNRAETAVVKRNEGAQLKGTSSMQVITLAGTTGAWEFNTGAGYLYAAGSGKSNNYLRTQAENDDNGKWTISITAAGVATITATGTNTNNQLKYNSSSKIFSCYGSGQAGVALYKEIPITVINDNDKDQDDVPDGGDMTIKEDKTWTVSSDKEVGDLYMEDGAIIANSAKIEANDLYFKAKAGKSNQIFDLSKITVVSNMYYDFQLCDGDVDANYWYSISVPFDVDLNDGVFQVGGTTPLVNHTDFEVWEYDTQKRADTQSNGWKRSSDNMMHAGKAYLIGFNPGQPNIIRLKAAAGWKTNLFSGTSMSVVSTGGNGAHDNWNGLANPTGRYIDVNVDAQAFNNNTHGWDSYALDAARFNFVVGTAFFVQSASAITIGNTDHGNYRAPKREGANESKCAYAVRITRDEATSFDNQIIVRASEDATSEYEQGHDMLTMNDATSKKAALLWTKNYGGKRLAIEEAPFVGDKASYELGIYAPANGTYFISVAEAKDNADLYLTYEGSIIWNLSAGAYEVELGKGATNEYGLMLVRKAPQVTTGVESVQPSAVGAQKVILDEKVFILRGGQMYDVTGKAVK